MTKKIKNNAGTTLVELMIYMIIASIVIINVYKVITEGTKTYVHNRAVSKGQFNARDAINSITKDIASMGYKKHFFQGVDANGDPATIDRVDEFGATRDSIVVGKEMIDGIERWALPDNEAAFFFTDGGDDESDTLEFFRIKTNENGERIARERIKYYLDGNNLTRVFWTFINPDIANANSFSFWETDDPDTLIIVSNIIALNFRFSRRGENYPTAWTSDIGAEANQLMRNKVRHVEVAILARAHREAQIQGRSEFLVGDREVEVDPEFIHRLYTQSIEVPNNGIGFEN